MTVEGHAVGAVTPAEDASGGKAVACAAMQCTASFRYAGAPGWYTLRVQYFDQNNGVSHFGLRVGSQLVDEWTAADRVPSARIDSSSPARRVIRASLCARATKSASKARPTEANPRRWTIWKLSRRRINDMQMRKGALIVLGAAALLLAAGPQTIHPGDVWPDDRGQHVQAHGGGIVKVGDAWYWFGEDRSQGLDPARRYVSCYSSNDLAHWTFRNQVMKQADPGDLGARFVLERPKVFYNAKTKKYVMYMHIDDARYALARVGVAVSDTVDGDYRYLRSFRPLGQESRDIGQFIDDDGSAYLIFEDRPAKGFHIAKLSDDYLNVEKDVCLLDAPLEGGAVVHYKGLYYALGSALTGWNPNP